MDNQSQDTPANSPEISQSTQKPIPSVTEESQQKTHKKDRKVPKTTIYIAASIILLAIGAYSLSTLKIFKPWKDYEGKVCSFGGCYTSETNQKYEYWKDQAIKENNPNLCNNVEGIDGGDIFISKKQAIELCGLNYAIETQNIDYCQSFTGYMATRCLGEIAVKYSMPELLSEKDCEQHKGKDFSDCVNLLVKVKKDDNYCDLLKDKKDWLGEQMCRQYANVGELKEDSVRKAVNSENIANLTLTCNSYKKLDNRATCYVDLIEGLIFNEGHAALEDYCLSAPINESWNVCLYMRDMGFSQNSAFTKAEDVKKRVLQEALSSQEWKAKFCDSVRWNTYGSKGIIDGDIKRFAVNNCELSYLE